MTDEIIAHKSIKPARSTTMVYAKIRVPLLLSSKTTAFQWKESHKVYIPPLRMYLSLSGLVFEVGKEK
ncbi:MAG: hypothetical protein EFT35_00620 [Methanophagales archaeon ANME-1-THS]|nr:MAG: hypothetical protein EFT35_00620 [Methanophagales archaeon ANME-1-THS]